MGIKHRASWMLRKNSMVEPYLYCTPDHVKIKLMIGREICQDSEPIEDSRTSSVKEELIFVTGKFRSEFNDTV